MEKFIMRNPNNVSKLPFRKKRRLKKEKKTQPFSIKSFTLKNKIHSTIYGATYKEHLFNKDWVVKVSKLKKIRKELECEDNYPENPIYECSLMKNIKPSPYILPIEAELKDKENHYIVMKYMKNGDLMDKINKYHYLSSKQSRKYMKQMLLGLKHLHSQGIAHLDFSPENILIDEDDNIKICDFGMSRKMKKQLNKYSNFPPEFDDKPGKDTYRAPEIEHNCPFSGEKADLYASGIILYGMLTGRFPYEEPTYDDNDFLVLWNESIKARLEDQYVDVFISKLALDFLNHILCPVEERYSVDEALAHPWLNKINKVV